MKTVLKSITGSIALLLMLTSLAAGEGLPDVLGIQLGMPARDAYTKLQSQLPKAKIQVDSVNLPTIDKPVMLTFTAVDGGAVGAEYDKVVVDLTLPPNKQVVWRVERTHIFPAKGILKSSLLASLREKYGKETQLVQAQGKPVQNENEITGLWWFMDEQGHPAQPPASVVQPLSTCPRTRAANQIVETPLPNYGNKDLAWCLSSYTGVNIGMTTNPSVPELYTQMEVLMVSLPIGSRAGEATKKWKDEIASGQHQQDVDAAKQQAKPKL